ncbi:hypothetical protein HJG54_04655 [Leptolyngbya sp. NK1-12]|uniref:Uncharacterized protein n=1 Tax=Leptolyngbya sp. NK1-12 TaxID=2547451 RepID=A0AA96WBM3_9CYAN|nr:hypothetical protein [Leptolyngbya sp. NK1-12]WNZ22223.1 hypothetical protein HJG54_04655 [Leptolyngbya sp. NK1-12]
MQPKTNKQFGWFGLLMIAVISGLIVRVVGDPLVEMFSPKIADLTEGAGEWLEDWFEDREWREKLQDWLDSDPQPDRNRSFWH